MRRDDTSYDDFDAAAWLRGVLLPGAVFVICAAVVCGLVLSGAVQGHKTYDTAPAAPRSQPTVLIQP